MTSSSASIPHEKKEAICYLPDSSTVYYSIINEMEDHAVMILDPNGAVRQANKGAEMIFGYTKEEITGKLMRNFYTPDDRISNVPNELMAEAIQNGKVYHAGWCVQKGGRLFRCRTTLVSLREMTDETIGFALVIQNISWQQQQVVASQKAINDNKEKENKTIAYAFYYRVGNAIGAALSLLQNIDPKNPQPVVNESERHLKRALAEIKNISDDIYPESVFRDGLPATIREEIKKIKNRHENMRVRFTCLPKKLKVETELQLALFRIVKEQLNNIQQHAGAGSVNIHLQRHKKKIVLAILDNGKGFDPSVANRGTGFQKILHLAMLYNGTTQFTSSEGKGCRVEVSIPIEQA